MVRSEKSKERRRRKKALEAEAASVSEMLEEEEEEEEEDDGGGKKNFQTFVREQCWAKAEVVKGRDPNRWRRDALGNIVFRNLQNCSGCLCHNYLPIIPFSKGGKTTLKNCQVLQRRVIREKGNQTDISSSHCRIEGRDMDLLEQFAYGNARRDSSGGCRIQ